MTTIDANVLNRHFRKHFHPEATFAVASSGLDPKELNKKDFELYQSFTSSKRKTDFLIGRKALYSFFKSSEQSDFCGKTHSRYSLSHSQGVALAMDTQSKFKGVGVDLEFWRESLVGSRHLYSTKDEWIFCQKNLDYLRLWAAKESIYKAFGDKDLRLLDIKCVDDKLSTFRVQTTQVACCVFQENNHAISAALVL